MERLRVPVATIGEVLVQSLVVCDNEISCASKGSYTACSNATIRFYVLHVERGREALVSDCVLVSFHDILVH